VKAHALADALIDRGLDPAEREAKQALFTGVLETWRTIRDDAPQYAWWVPGRLEVFGKHTDYAGGRTLVAAAPRGFAVAASARSDAVVRVIDARRGESLELAPSPAAAAAARKERLTGWRHYVDVAARRLAKNFPHHGFGAEIVLASDLPPAAGMSSSSALLIAIAEALGRIGGIARTPEWKLNIRSPLDVAGYYACIENGRSFGGLSGDVGVGTHGGSEDHSAILNGLPRHVLGFAFVPSRAFGAARVPDEWQFVIATCGVKANKTGGARDAYNKLSADAAALLELWNGRGAGGPRAISLAAVLERPDHAETLRAMSGELASRLQHFVREDARIPEAMRAFERGDKEALARLSRESQSDAERLLGNQIPETIALVSSARKAGAFAACSFGAGFGGAAWALVEATSVDHFRKKWGRDAFAIRPGPALTDLSTK
jgi:galactokinase